MSDKSDRCSGTPDEASAERIGPYYIRGALQGAVRKGFDPMRLLAAAGIDTSVYSDPNASLDGQQLQRLILTINNALNDEYMGFLPVQGKLEMGMTIARAAVRSQTLDQALHRIAELVNAVRSDIEISRKTDAAHGEVSIITRMTSVSEGVEPHLIYWFKMYWVYKFLCWLVGQRIRLARVCFSSARPAHAIDYSKVFDCPVSFEQPHDSIAFSLGYLEAPVVCNEAELLGGEFLKTHTDWFEIPEGVHSVSAQVERLLEDLYAQEMTTPTLQVLAEMLCVCPRTLSRRLSREKASFQHLKDKVRSRRAQHLLATTTLSIAHIAGKAGFAEPADFTRAYVRWTGETPSEYRERCSRRS